MANPNQTNNAPYGSPSKLAEPTNRQSVFVLGLISVFFLGFIFGPVAIAKSKQGRLEIREGRAPNDGLFKTGYVLAIVGTVLGILSLLALITFFVFIYLWAPSQTVR